MILILFQFVLNYSSGPKTAVYNVSLINASYILWIGLEIRCSLFWLSYSLSILSLHYQYLSIIETDLKRRIVILRKKKKLRKNWRTFCLPFSYYADILCINLIKEFNMLLSTKGNTFLDFILHSDSVKLVIPMVLCCISFYHELDYKVFKEEKSLITEIILKY